MICCTLLRGVIGTSAGVLSISTRFHILAALAKSSRVSLKSSLLSITAPAAWPRGVPAEREERPFSVSCNAVVHSVSNIDKQTSAGTLALSLYLLLEFVNVVLPGV